MEDTVFKLITRFDFRKPVEIIQSDHQGVVVETESVKFYIDDKTLPGDMIETVALAKMSENDPLLSVVRFQKHPTDEECEYARWFHALKEPLQRGWTYGFIRRHAPDLYEQDMREVNEMWNIIADDNEPLYLPSQKGMIAFALYAIAYENPENNIELNLGDRDLGWGEYSDKLTTFVRTEPDTAKYLSLIEYLDLPFVVTIVKDEGMLRYDIRKRA